MDVAPTGVGEITDWRSNCGTEKALDAARRQAGRRVAGGWQLACRVLQKSVEYGFAGG